MRPPKPVFTALGPHFLPEMVHQQNATFCYHAENFIPAHILRVTRSPSERSRQPIEAQRTDP